MPTPTQFSGTLDSCQDGVVAGWAHLPDADHTKVYVWLNERLVRVSDVDIPRPDVVDALGLPSLNCGFSVDISSELSKLRELPSTSHIQVAVTVDRDGQSHLTRSPLMLPQYSLTLRSLHFQFPATLRAEFWHPAAAAEFAGRRAVLLEIDSIATVVSFDAEVIEPLFGLPGSSLQLSDPSIHDVDLVAAIDSLMASRHVGHEHIEGRLRNDDASITQAVSIPIDDLVRLLVHALLESFTLDLEPTQPGRAGQLGPLASMALDLVNHNFLGVAEPLIDAIGPAVPDNGDADTIVTWTRVLHALWNKGLWFMYARAIQPLLLSATALEHLTAAHRACLLPTLWDRAVKLLDGRLAPEADAAAIEAAVDDAWPVVNDDIAMLLKRNDSAVVGQEWARTLIVPCLNFFARRRSMLRSLLRIELETACLRISTGTFAGFNRVTAGSLLIEPLFQHIERIFKDVSLRYSSEITEVFHEELSACFIPGTLLHAMVNALGDPTAEVLRDDPIEQMAADVVICGSESRRCHYGRLHAMNALATHLDTWREAWLEEQRQRSHLYSFESPIKNRPLVFMAKSHTRLKEAMHQISEDLPPLIDNEGLAAFAPSDMVVFDAVDLSYAAYQGRLVVELAKAMGHGSQRGQTIIFAPWLSLGGADAYCAAMANAITTRTGTPPVICLTESSNADGAPRLHPHVRVVDLSHILSRHHADQQSQALAMALSVVRPAVVLNFNSRLLWASLAKYHRRLIRESRYGCMFFCDDLDSDGVPHSYLRHNAHIFSTGQIWALADSVDYFRRVAQELSLPTERAVGIRFPPARAVAAAAIKANYKATNRVLWCGRYDRQKRLDILVNVARSLPDVDFHVYGFPMLDSNPDLVRTLRSCPNVKERGRYKSFSEIDVEEYDCLLITTQWEGVPNVLLESGVRGLPVIAPLVGGIPETLGGDRGYPVKSYDRMQDYVQALRDCLRNREEAAAKAARMVAYIRDRHSEASLDKSLEQLGY